MEVVHRRTIPGPPGRAFALIDDLLAYPQWMDLVHDVVVAESSASDPPAWEVELRAQVGPFARSKRLRMVRVVHEPCREVVFERSEVDGRRHSPWMLRATLGWPAGSEPPLQHDVGEIELEMTLTYGGNLWTGAVLQRVLDDHVERGTTELRALLARR